MRWRLACFDLDGTLVHGTTTCQHLGDIFGHGDVIRALERRYANGEITNEQVAVHDAAFYTGMPIDDVAMALESIPLIAGIMETVDDLRGRGLRLLLTTVTWEFAAEIIAKRFGFDGWTGCVMRSSGNGTLSGSIEQHFEAADKLRFVEYYCERHGLSMADVLAVGDSRSDIPLFGAVGFSIALNATEAARSAASCSVDSKNLRDVLRVIPLL